MTNYTIREDAIAFDARIANAPDTASKLNLLEELRERYLSIATSAQMLAESNNRWATESRETRDAVEAIILDLVEMFDNDSVPSGLSEIAKIFDIELTGQRTYTITISASVSVMVPKWFDGTPSAWDFTTSGLRIEHDEFDIEIDDYSIESVEE